MLEAGPPRPDAAAQGLWTAVLEVVIFSLFRHVP